MTLRVVTLTVPFESAAGVSLGELVTPIHLDSDGDPADRDEISLRLVTEAYGSRYNVNVRFPGDSIAAGQLRAEPVVLRANGRELVSGTTYTGQPLAFVKEQFTGAEPRLLSIAWADE